MYAAFGKDESLLKKNLLILFQLVDWIVSQVRGFTSRARSLVQVQDSPAAPGKIVGRKIKSILLLFFFFFFHVWTTWSKYGGYSSVGRAPLLQLGRCDYGLDV